MIEDQYLEKEPRMVAEKIFPLNWHFPPSDIRKTQKFYENILIETKSIVVKHYKFQNINAFTHSIVQILSVLTPVAWGRSPCDFKKLSQDCDPQYFNYWVYIAAWSNAFFYQNPQHTHSWLFHFKHVTKYHFPYWLKTWWDYFGPTSQILPPPIFDSFNLFQEKAIIPFRNQNFPILLDFYSQFALSWIIAWEHTFI